MQIIIGTLVFLFGASVGSFVSASVWRIERGEPVVRGRSKCESCGKTLAFFELIPILSFIFLRGRCRKCGRHIDAAGFIMEIVCGALFVAAYFYEPSAILLARDFIFLGGLAFLFLYDLKYGVLPDIASIPLTLAMLALNFAAGADIFNLLLAASAGGGFFLLQYLISRGRWIGSGDIRLGALLGAGLGWPNIILAVFAAYILGALSGIFLILRKKKNLKSEMVFGTFLAVGGAIALFWGEEIIKWYFSIIQNLKLL